MQEQLENKLFESYRKILTKLVYFEVGDGWYDLLDDLLEELLPFEINIVQIKSKFGGLRVYYDIIDSLSAKDLHKINNSIKDCEFRSITTCEECGKKGGRKSCLGWINTLCDEHYQEWLNKHSVRK